MKYEILPLGALQANCIILWDDPSAALIVDPGAEHELLLQALAKYSLTPAAVALTHAHFDHIGAIPGLLAKYPALDIHISPGDVAVAFDPRNAWEPDYSSIPRPKTLVADLTDDSVLSVVGISARIVSTPGHTPGGVCFYFESDNLLLTGDTLFAGSCGRTDFPGGDFAAMQKSLARLAAFPPATTVIAGHGASTTIAAERASNQFLQ